MKKENFCKRLSPFAKPCCNNVIAILASVIQGSIMPVFGALLTYMLFALMQDTGARPGKPAVKANLDKIWNDALYYVMWMGICTAVSFFTGFCQKYLFGVVGENVTQAMRSKLYMAFMRKDIGWFDHSDNNSGVLTGILAKDIQLINGAATEGMGSQFEAVFALLVGIILAFIFQWKVTLVCFACVPIMAISGYLQGKMQAGLQEFDEEAMKEANSLATDCIINYRTVQSFGNNDYVLKSYSNLLAGPSSKATKHGYYQGFLFGFSQFA